MKPFFKYLLLAFAGNVALIAIFFLATLNSKEDSGLAILLFGLLVCGIAFIIQIIWALTLIYSKDRTERKLAIGQALLISVGLILLIGLSLCSGVFR